MGAAFIPHDDEPYPEASANLLAAAYCGSVEDIRECLNAGAEINARTLDWYTPLMYAVMFGTAEAVKVLIDAGADVNARNFQRQTALSLAVISGGVDNQGCIRALCVMSTKLLTVGILC